MVEIREGLQLPITAIRNNIEGLTYQGQELQFECVDEDNQVYTARTKLTDADIKAGHKIEHVFTIQFPFAEGTLIRSEAHPEVENEHFKNLTDAEKLTKLNSLEYTIGESEGRQVKDASEEGILSRRARAAKPDSKAAIEEAKKQDVKDAQERKEDVAKEQADKNKQNNLTLTKEAEAQVKKQEEFKKS